MPIRAYKLRLYPNPTQEGALARWFGHSRWVWNWELDARRKACARRGQTMSSYRYKSHNIDPHNL